MKSGQDKTCEQFSRMVTTGRRQILQAGLLGGLGLTLPDLLRAEELTAQSGSTSVTGQSGGSVGTLGPSQTAKRCIFLFMWGGPSQLDTFDLKPLAPSDIRGEFRPIATRTPGVQICEHFSRLAGLTDKFAIVRSLHHDDPAHLSSGHTTVTGQLPPVNKSDAEPPSDRDTPHFGCVMSHLRPAPPVLPSFVMLPWRVLHPAAPGGEAPGQHGGWLGHNVDPFVVSGDPSRPDWHAPSLALAAGMTTERMQGRRELLAALDTARRNMDAEAVRQKSFLDQRAFELLASPRVRDAFDLSRETAATRERYGMNLHGQCVLLARRLVEHGVPIVTVNWHNDGRNFWDTHGDNFRRLKHDLIPVADAALSALLQDLSDRGLLDDTLVVWVGEFGRKPQITPGNAGREHWPYCYSGLLAGGGIRGGAVYGASDPHAAYPSANPVSPQDLMATVYQALGVPQSQVLYDTSNRPRNLYAGSPIHALFG